VALRTLDDTDPFACGRRITLRWGKNIIREASQQDATSLPSQQQQPNAERPTIQVQVPAEASRERWIATVADFVARDGSEFENALLLRERGNPRFDFLLPGSPDHAYYKWRVYAFCQGDYYGTRNAPFSMLEGGCVWVPPRPPTPPVAESASRDEVSGGTSSISGRRRTDGHARLDERELAQAHRLFNVELCASRQSICRAMAFCFDKAPAAYHVASLLRDLFVVEESKSANTASRRPPTVSVETLISRLYLVSDVLFNSQQPDIKHAFLYRSAVETMAPEVFSALGMFSRRQQSRGRRWTRHHKLATCVHVVLQAWSAWDVYPPTFLQELQALFDGREVDKGATSEGDGVGLADQRDGDSRVPDTDTAHVLLVPQPVVREVAQGQWSTIEETIQVGSIKNQAAMSDDCKPEATTGSDMDREPLEDERDPEGESLGEEEGEEDDDPDGEPLDEDDHDGEPLEDADLYGEPLDDDDADGEPIDSDEILASHCESAAVRDPES
jgi:U2-associated protein SR140